MITPDRPRGLWCAALTPLAADGGIDAGRLAVHVRRIFAAGVDGIALFGTTGEGQSFSLAERRAGLESLLAAGIDPRRVMVGTGCAALPETIELTRHAVGCGCAGALVLPPFFFRSAGDDGVFACYTRLVEEVADDRLRVYLYHIPQMTGIGLSPAVIERLAAAWPRAIAGIKDSSCDLDHEQDILRRFPNLDVFVGYEPHLPAAIAGGGVGTVCGIANVFPRTLRRLLDGADAAARAAELAKIERLVSLLDRYPLMPAFKAIQAALTGDDGWRAVRAPLVALDAAARRTLLAELAATGLDATPDGAGPT